MAVSIVSNFTSNKFYTVNNHIAATVTSAANGNCNFRYICDIYINGTKVFTDKLFPDPTTGYGFFKIDRVIQDYIKDSLPATPYTNYFNAASSTTAPAAVLSVYCRFGEEYDSSVDCDGTVVQYLNQVTSNTFYAFNGAIDYEDLPTWQYTKHLGVWASASYATREFLTNSPREVDVTFNDSYYLDIYSLTNPTVYTSPGAGNVALAITTYNKGGAVSTITVPANAITGTPRRYRIACGPYDLNNFTNIPLINDSISKYEIKLVWQVGSSNPFDLSETFTFYPKRPGKFQTRIGFIGRLGSIEHFTFYHRNKKSFDIDRKDYEKNMYSNTSGVWGYAVGDRGTSTYKISATEKHTVSSFCSKEWSDFLYEMWMSPEVWTYKRPELLEYTVYRESSSPSSRMLFVLPDENHGFSVGDSFFSIPCYEGVNDTNSDYYQRFTVTGVSGRYVDCGLTYNIYNLCEFAEGWLYKDENWNRLPIVISDNNIEVKQKLTKPIEYTLNYKMAYPKNTLRP